MTDSASASAYISAAIGSLVVQGHIATKPRINVISIVATARAPISHAEIVRLLESDGKKILKTSATRVLRTLRKANVITFAFGGYLPNPSLSPNVIAIRNRATGLAHVEAMTDERVHDLTHDIEDHGAPSRMTLEVEVLRPGEIPLSEQADGD